jgi:hypothetical protein
MHLVLFAMHNSTFDNCLTAIHAVCRCGIFRTPSNLPFMTEGHLLFVLPIRHLPACPTVY